MRKRLNITLDDRFLPLVDEFAEKKFVNRSTLIHLALEDYMKRDKRNKKNK